MSPLRHARASIRVRGTLVAAAAALAATTLGSVLFVVSLHSSLEAGLVTTAKQEVSAISAQLAKGADPQQVVITGGNDVVTQLVATDGRVVASDHRATRTRPLLAAPGVQADMQIPGERDSFTVVVRRMRHDSRVAMIVVGRSTEQTDRAGTIAIALLVIAVPVVVALIAFIVWLSIGRALRPVESMRREADAITSSHLGSRLAVPPGDDEIPRLAETLNEMLDRIDESHHLQRQFVSNASHELRSPLSAIRQSAEIARAYPERVSMSTLAGDVLVESSRLEGLVNALLLLARLDDVAPERHTDPVDLDDLVILEVERLKSTRRGLPVDISRVSSGQVLGDTLLLAQVVRNLIENASRHAVSRVCITLQEAGGKVVLLVDDDGVGVPPADRTRIFERFVRLDEARARDDGGAGLGLAIVSKIVERAHGVVEVSSSPLGGARFSVVLPAAE